LKEILISYLLNVCPTKVFPLHFLQWVEIKEEKKRGERVVPTLDITFYVWDAAAVIGPMPDFLH
jgi:hypothetical protein